MSIFCLIVWSILLTFLTHSGLGRDSWIGLNDQATEGAFAWSDNSTVDFMAWNGADPDGGEEENCVLGNSKDTQEWIDTKCSNHHAYACKYPVPMWSNINKYTDWRIKNWIIFFFEADFFNKWKAIIKLFISPNTGHLYKKNILRVWLAHFDSFENNNFQTEKKKYSMTSHNHHKKIYEKNIRAQNWRPYVDLTRVSIT